MQCFISCSEYVMQYLHLTFQHASNSCSCVRMLEQKFDLHKFSFQKLVRKGYNGRIPIIFPNKFKAGVVGKHGLINKKFFSLLFYFICIRYIPLTLTEQKVK